MMFLVDYYFLAGIFFVFMAILVIIRNLRSNKTKDFFWFCDMAPFILAFAFFTQNQQLLKGLINIGFIAQWVSLIPLSSAIFFHKNLIGFADILNYDKFHRGVSLLLHSATLNIALLFTYNTKPGISSLVYSLFILTILFILTLLFTSRKENVNYVYHTDFLGFKIPGYTSLWIFITFILVIFPTYLLQYLLYILAT
jgi:hypothetical protein